MNAFLIVMTGVATYVIGKAIVSLVLAPLQEFKKCLREISFWLSELAQFYANPGTANVDVEKSASEQLRSLSCHLISKYQFLPLRGILSAVFDIPKSEAVAEAAKQLMALSNGFVKTDKVNIAMINLVRAQKIKDYLGIYHPESERINDEQMEQLGIPKAI